MWKEFKYGAFSLDDNPYVIIVSHIILEFNEYLTADKHSLSVGAPIFLPENTESVTKMFRMGSESSYSEEDIDLHIFFRPHKTGTGS